MKSKWLMLAMAGALTLAGLTAQAQDPNAFPDPSGSLLALTGDPEIDNPAFSPDPGTDAFFRNDGTNGDVTAGDLVWTINFTPLAASDNSARIQWKAAASGWNPEVPTSDNSWTRVTATPDPITFFVDAKPRDDGWIPDPGSGVAAFGYTVPSPIVAGDVLSAVGDFQSELGGSDWTTNDINSQIVYADDGVAPDAIAGDGIFTAEVVGLPAGAWTYKILVNAVADGFSGKEINAKGFATGGGNLTFTVIEASDTITLFADANQGRTRFANDNPLANPGPPFFATSDAWSQVLGPETQLFDDGTNGDITAGDGIHSREFSISNTAQEWTLQIRQGQGPTFPGGKGYPFVTTRFNQTILVQFDTNDRSADGYLPPDNYVFVNPEARRLQTRIQPTGNWMVNLGAASDWDPQNVFFEATDDGSDPNDAAAGDQVWTRTFGGAPALTGKVWKATGEEGPDPDDQSSNPWLYQFGSSAFESYTKDGDNTNIPLETPAGDLVFKIDAITGRAASTATDGTQPGEPTRPATFDAVPSVPVLPNAAKDWEFFE